jgi:hypothetical protein
MSHPHWQYFIAIESDLERTGRYVEIAQDNFHTYSIEFARILLSASSEVDVVSKLVCEAINPSKSYKTIDDYRECMLSRYPKFPSFEITIPRYGLVRTPWQDWGRGRNPSWWKSYNNVKHERNKFFGEANLENAVDAVAGLFCVVLAYNHDLLETSPWPKLLTVEENMMVAMVFN